MSRTPYGKCPHAKIQYCPLYIGMHIAGGPSCWHRNLEEGCAVDHGAPYEELLAKFFRVHPDIVAERAMAENADEASEQRSRNMRSIGLH